MPEGWSIDKKAVEYLLYGKVPTRDIVPIYPDMRRRAEQVKLRAIFLAGKRTGRLAKSIKLEDSRVPAGWHFKISANVRYAYWHHQGTKPHKIEGPLEFRARGRIIVVKRVAHPGTRPNPYLKNALPAFMATRDNRALLR